MKRQILFVLCLSIFAATLGQGLVVPFLPTYAKSMGASGFFIGLIFGAFSITRSLFLPFFGRLSDLFGRKPFITCGLVFYFLASIAFMLTHSVAALIIIRLLQGISSAMILPVAQSYATDISRQGEEGTILSFLNIALYAGLSAGPFLGGVVKDSFGIQASFGGMSFVCLIGLLLSIFFLPADKQNKKSKSQKPTLSLGKIISNPNVIGISIIRFGYVLCVGSIWAFLPLIAEVEYKLTSTTIGLLMSMIVLISAVLSAPVGVLSDHYNKRILTAIGSLLTLLGIFILYFPINHFHLFLVTGLVGVGGGFLTPATSAMSAVVGKKMNSIGTVISITTMGHSLGMFAGPLMAGLFFDYYDAHAAFFVNAIVFLLLLISGFFLTNSYSSFEYKKEATQ